VWAFPGLLLLIGVVIVPVGHAPADFGWFAYTPLEGDQLLPWDGFVLLTGTAVLGMVLVVLGVAGLAAWAGYRLGRRAAAR
jgi:heme/copper-type cytochrome/quinol oxidase subunit 1